MLATKLKMMDTLSTPAETGLGPASRIPVSAIVLAAGMSTRMGGENKLLLDFAGRPLVRHVVETIVEAGLQEVLVVLGHEAERVEAALKGLSVEVVRNDRFEEGMTTSIHAGVEASSTDASGYMICLSDLPLLEADDYRYLAMAFLEALDRDAGSILVPFHEGARGNPVIFSTIYRDNILAEQGLNGCRGLVKQNRNHVVEIETDTNHVIVDIDTLADFDTARTLPRRRSTEPIE